MKKFPKIIAILTSFVIVFTTFASTGMVASANEGDSNGLDEDTREQIKEELAEDLEFYFDTVGYINEDQEYIITDEEAFIQKIESDFNVDIDEIDEEAKAVLNTSGVQPASATDYAICVVVNSLPFGGVAWEIANATSELDGFIDALTALNFQVASDMLMNVAGQYLTDAALEELANISLAANIAASVVSCGLE